MPPLLSRGWHELQALPLDRKLKKLYIISVAQFRPEKNHSLQLRAFALARSRAMGAAPSAAGQPCSIVQGT